MKRKRYTERQILAYWEASDGHCWRCELKIEKPRYGVNWVLGHCKNPHWLGGAELAAEHVACNVRDAKVQTKLAAKSVRIRARAAGIKKRSRPFPGGKDDKRKRKVSGEVVLR